MVAACIEIPEDAAGIERGGQQALRRGGGVGGSARIESCGSSNEKEDQQALKWGDSRHCGEGRGH